MGLKAYLIFLCTLAVLTHHSYGCEMGNINWLFPQHVTIQDVFRGEFFNSDTLRITGVNSVVISESLNRGPYFDFLYANDQFTISTTDAYADYEEYETELSVSVTVLFNCDPASSMTTRQMVFVITINDTNNNDPHVRPSTELQFTVFPPLPPGFLITGCGNDIFARDIDLTTQRVEFNIFDTPYFEIAYDQASSTVAKEFQASLKTTTFIRSIPEPLVFRISATDVDLTGDPQRTTYATVTIASDVQFELPEEPVFSRAFYLATYTEDHQVVLQETISLQKGYHADVQFSLGPEYSQFFRLEQSSNQITIQVDTQLPEDLLILPQLLLVVNAQREHTSGATATVVLELPEEEGLKFQQPSYEGSIVDNELQLTQLVLTQGYEVNPVSLEIISEHSTYFNHVIEQNTITLSMTPLPSSVIEQNNFLNLQVVASTNRTSASTIVTLEIVKDDGVTPVFERALYEGRYDPDDGLHLDTIVMIQGYDNTVQVALRGEHAALFQLVPNGPNFDVTTTGLPTELFVEGNVLLTLAATKPRTVGANTAISIALPAETQLEFEQQNYEGIIEDNILQLTQLTLSQGYESGLTSVLIQGSPHASYFTPVIQNNSITISMAPLPADIIQMNTFLNLQVFVSTDRSSASTIVTLEIIKDDYVTPVFEQALYEGSYDPVNGLTLDEIVLVQGYDETVQLSLHGDHSSYFEIDQDGRFINLTVSSLPPTLFSERTLLLTIEAAKPRTVGSNAAISIALPEDRELRFSAAAYSATIRDDDFNHEEILLNVGFTNEVVFTLSGAYEPYFGVTNVQNQVFIELRQPLPDIVITENNFLHLTLSASAPNAITTSTTVVLDIIREDTTTPRFNQDIYFATYTDTSSVEIGPIYLIQGFDSTVSFRLDGVFSQYFGITNSENIVTLTLQFPIPREVIFDEKVLTFGIVAEKELTVGATAAVSIRFPSELTHPTVLSFSKNVYVGSLEGSSLNLENIIIENGLSDTTDFQLYGDYSSYFTYTPTTNGVTISIANALPPEVLTSKFITLELEARGLRAVPVTTIIVIDVIQPDVVLAPVFSEAFYRGVYTVNTGLQFEEPIIITEGFDDTVLFELVGEFSQWFAVSQNNNVATITVRDGLPEDVFENNNNLLFTVVATKPGATNGIAVISVDLPKEVPAPLILRFTQASYVGQIINGSLALPPVTLIGEPDAAINLNATGEFASYFTLSRESNAVSIILNDNFPSEVIGENAFIHLDIEANYPEAISGYTTVIFEIVKEPDTQIVTPVFEQAYYIGEYSNEGGLVFDQTIRLSQGFDETVSFTLAGEHSQAFSLVENGQNNFTLTLSENEMENLNNIGQLIFSVVASKLDGSSGRAAIVIALTDLLPARQLRFAQDHYTGATTNGLLSINSIVLEEGYTTGIQYSLTGDYENYFQITQQNGIFTLTQLSTLPPEVINNNDFLILTLVAQLENTRAHTTIVLEIVRDDSIILLQFSNPYYVGSYSANGLNFEGIIALEHGYDDQVEFILQGENAQWFDLSINDNSVTLVLTSSIPPAVIANNQQIIFTINAVRPGSTNAQATIVISLNDEINSDEILGFDRINYVGTIVENSVSVGPITLSEGYTSAVAFTLQGDLASYFSPNAQGNIVSVVLNAPIPAESIPSNRVILLELQASAPPALPAFATIVLEVVQDDVDTPLISPVFAEPFYTGSYSADGTLVFNSVISLAEGYDPTVVFELEGEHSQWFSFTRATNAVTLILSNPIPPAVIVNNQQLIFTISAQRPGTTTARATISISLSNEITPDEILGFDRINYVGTIEENSVSVGPITLSEGYTSAVAFTLHGDLASYFSPNAQGNIVSIVLNAPLPAESIPSNRVILLELQASAPPALPAFTTIVLEVVQDDVDTPLISPVFAEPFYTGSYSADGTLVFNSVISLSEGYDPTVVFELEGEHSQWFSFNRAPNAVTLVLSNPIPPAVIVNNQQLIFTISAQRPGTTTARATISISLSNEITPDEILGFDRINYVGTIVENSVSVGPITLSEGDSSAVAFTLHGDLASYFSPNAQGNIVSIVLNAPLPAESIPSNRVILLELQASAPPALPAFATIVLEVVQDDIDTPLISPVFAEPFYTGSYSADGTLAFNSVISLAEGYDPSIVFELEGEHSQWFSFTRATNAVTLVLSNPIPPAVIVNNQQLIFTISAQRPGTTTARATISISLSNEISPDEILGFDRINYVGTIVENSVSVGPITLSEGYTSAVAFTLHGDLASYFSPNAQGNIVSIVLNAPIPAESIPSNRVILLELQASAPPALPAFATIVLEVVQDDVDTPLISPVFAEPFYTGSYSADGTLVFNSVISLVEGYDPTIVFELEGEHSQWFSFTRATNAVTLILSNPIPPAVIVNNQQLIFTISAQRPGTTTARATISISLSNEITPDEILGFDRINYVGTIVENSVSVGPITLSEGYTSAVAFTLHGDLAGYFSPNAQGDIVSIVLNAPIPAESIPSNRVILLELQASAPPALPAFATIVLEVVQDDVDTPLISPVFAEPFYTGSYSADGTLVFNSVISLVEGYDPTIVFELEGEHSQWFSITRATNAVTLVLSNPIPPAVIVNNQQLIFTISAQRPGTTTARATISISLSNEITPDEILGFDRINYVGTIVENSVSVGPITLSEGYTSAVAFTLHGDLASYFSPNAQGNIVSIVLNAPLPAESIPSNKVILLELQASAPPALPAFATIVLEVVQDDVDTPLISPVFAEPFYTGSYSADGTLVFNSVISLAEGYDPTIVFELEGEHSQWFSFTRATNAVTLVLSNPIPPAVIINNQQLIFTISAQRPGTTTARATISISLSNEITPDEILGFDRINYVGTIVENSVSVGPITLSEGYTSAVAFTLHGDLASYFSPNAQGNIVSIVLNAPLPAESIPSNRVILLELQASAPPALPAFATIVLEVVEDDVDTPLISPVFAEPFYTGSYSADGTLVFNSVISLAEGYDPTIVFELEGEHSQWFSITRATNAVTLILSNPIPPAVIVNNQQLIFTISAQRPGTTTARATISISLSNEITPDEILGFDRINYVGTIVENSVSVGPITLSEGYTSAVAFTLHGDLATYFSPNAQGNIVSIVLNAPIPAESIPSNRVILLELQASAPPALPAFATIVLEVVQDDERPVPTELVFEESYFVGTYTINQHLIFDTPITLAGGFDQIVEFSLTGENSEYFILIPSGNSVRIELLNPLPSALVADNLKLVFVLTAERSGSRSAQATVIIMLERDNSSVIFDKVLYEGIIQSGVVNHATITVTGHEGNNVNLVGVYASFFSASLSGNVVAVTAASPLPIPANVNHVVLELRIASSGAVLVLEVVATEGPVLPTVSFEATSYALRVEIGQTGVVGRVSASADNGEAVTYSLIVANEHLRGRITISGNGEILLFAPANSGVYSFEAIATTVFSEATATATIHLSVEAITVCDNETVTPPLIVVDRNEEEPLRDLVLLNPTEHAGCRYTLSSRWPANQNWLYVDDTGLHSTAIDREHPSIAFMALSQVQVELVLTCDSDATRSKRSTDTRLDWLGPYDYGTQTWLLGETISHNPRRSIVNLVVNDINDNAPIFVGVEDQPIVVGYPISELEETIQPRSLAELKATDADVGINAALVYWSSAPELAVSPTTGFVHVRNDQRLQQDQILTVSATDQNGEGLSGSITLQVKLLDTSNIAVITIRDAFLEDENRILGNISNVIGYEVRSLRSVVITVAQEERSLRMKRQANDSGASLEVYVYGLVQREPVAVDILKTDINNAAVAAVNIANIQSLQDHLDARLICDDPGRDTGLLVATIVLSVLFFILIVAIIVWFVLKRIKKNNYNQFSDANSLASQNESLGQPAKPLDGVAVAKPRLNIEELKRSERRLQDMLNAPVELAGPSTEPEMDVRIEPKSFMDSPTNSVTKIPLPDPIVIQDKLKDAADESDDDEFGERKKPRRKSVVTFNENVEKIIHVEEDPTVNLEHEVYKL